MKAETDRKFSNTGSSATGTITDARIDPYAAREKLEDQEARYRDWTRVKEWVANNEKIEQILTSTTDRILRQNCEQNKNYLEQFAQFCKDNT